MNCVNCNKTNLSFVDSYKIEIDSDIEYLGAMDIYSCNDCQLSFSYPMPESKKLDYFYSQVYRNKYRPHYYDSFFKKNTYLDNMNLDYVSYLTTFIDFNKVTSILDFGAGIGNIGFALKQVFNHLELHCCESDENCLETLKQRGYKNYKNLDEIDKKFDLVISLHCFEHLTDLGPVKKLKSFLNPGGFYFFEVPNSDFNSNYKQRVFDSPHLLFFNKKSLENIFSAMNLEKINLIVSSYTINEDFIIQKLSKDFFNKKTLFFKFKSLFKIYTPYFLISFIKKFKKFNKSGNPEILRWHANGRTEGRFLRGLYK